METRRLGRTEHHSSLAVLGAAAFWDATPERAEQSFQRALFAGVNHLDVAPQYGKAQALLGPLLPAVRNRLFVACKTLRHHPDGVRAQLEESLGLLGCNSFDLYQLHAVNDLEELESRRDAIEAVFAARDEGLCRFVGITGHNLTAPATHRVALERYDFDTVMFPMNPRLWGDDEYRRDAEALLEEASTRDVGVMAIKAGAARPWEDRAHTSSTWYEPFVDTKSLERGIRFTLSVPGIHAFCTPGDTEVLDEALQIASAFVPMSEEERDSAVEQVAEEPLIFPMPTH
jgi:aryl-alcohol dehydrogenase-like predicted oxidoreductase